MSTTTSTNHYIPPRVLTIAGSDSGGSAGIQADLKTFAARGVFGTSAITVVTAQDTQAVYQAHPLPEAMIQAQIEAVLNDIGANVIKTGLLGRASVIQLTATVIQAYAIQQLVVDPVLVDGKGRQIVTPEALIAYQALLFPLATVITPNLDEAALLTGLKLASQADLFEAARQLHAFGAKTILIKGGHLSGENEILDLFYDGQQFIELTAPRLPVHNPHGVGCTFASAIAAELAKGQSPDQAVHIAHQYLQRALAGSQSWQIGQGRSPVNHGIDQP